jgi:predicted nucleotidyltransferase
MDAHVLLQLPERHRTIIERFVAACRADERVVAAFLGGSYARGAADGSSDLDLYVITADGTYADFFADRAAFVRQLGEPVFLEDFDAYGFDLVLFIFAEGVEGELALGREGSFQHIHGGPHVVLLDKTEILERATFPAQRPSVAEQVERLRRLVVWFWHDLAHHVLTPLARGQLWTAVGAVEDLRRSCVELARLAADFTAAAEGYEQVERVVPAERLAALAATFCPPERRALLGAAKALVDFYQEVAPALAQAHGISYPTALDAVICARLEALDDTPSVGASGD